MSLQQSQALVVIDSHITPIGAYIELAEKARRCAADLTEHGIQPRDNVAVTMSKGSWQVVSILVVLLVRGNLCSRITGLTHCAAKTHLRRRQHSADTSFPAR